MLSSPVVGMSHVKGVRDLCEGISEGDPIELREEPYNRVDPNAIAVLNRDGVRIGYLPARIAERIAGRKGLWVELVAEVKEVDLESGFLPKIVLDVRGCMPEGQPLLETMSRWVRERVAYFADHLSADSSDRPSPRGLENRIHRRHLWHGRWIDRCLATGSLPSQEKLMHVRESLARLEKEWLGSGPSCQSLFCVC